MKQENAAVAELALKVYSLGVESDVRRNFHDADRLMQSASGLIELREAPEDAVCSLVIDLMHYCKQEIIDWQRDVIDRAHMRFHATKKLDTR
jgi:hypothetical protein